MNTQLPYYFSCTGELTLWFTGKQTALITSNVVLSSKAGALVHSNSIHSKVMSRHVLAETVYTDET